MSTEIPSKSRLSYEEYLKRYFPSMNDEAIIKASSPQELGTKLADEVLVRLKVALVSAKEVTDNEVKS